MATAIAAVYAESELTGALYQDNLLVLEDVSVPPRTICRVWETFLEIQLLIMLVDAASRIVVSSIQRKATQDLISINSMRIFSSNVGFCRTQIVCCCVTQDILGISSELSTKGTRVS